MLKPEILNVEVSELCKGDIVPENRKETIANL
jgi:hypothetical protein